MASLWSKFAAGGKRALDMQGYVDLVTLKGNQYLVGTGGGTLAQSEEEQIESNFSGYAWAMMSNPIVFGAMVRRLTLFTEARFCYQRMRKGRPSGVFADPSLKPLEEPWPGATAADLLKRMIQDADLSGNFFGVKLQEGELKRLRPDWVTIVLGTPRGTRTPSADPQAIPIGYTYTPGGRGSGQDPIPYLADQVVHFAPIPDPLYAFRGMSWLTPIIREIEADGAGTVHKLKYLEQGATPNMIVTTDSETGPEEFAKFKELFEAEHGGLENAYGTIFLGGGAKAEVVGQSMKDVDFKSIQALGENRIAVASGVPAIVIGTSEGLEAATYSNFGQARRAYADGTMSPLWREACAALTQIVAVPSDAVLWYDVRDIPFLQEDRKDEAEIQNKDAVTVEVLIKGGFEPDSVVDAVTSHDFGKLTHSGLVSVQLQEPGAEEAEAEEPPVPPPTAGNGIPPAPDVPSVPPNAGS